MSSDLYKDGKDPKQVKPTGNLNATTNRGGKCSGLKKSNNDKKPCPVHGANANFLRNANLVSTDNTSNEKSSAANNNFPKREKSPAADADVDKNISKVNNYGNTIGANSGAGKQTEKTLEDPFCLESNPRKITFQDVTSAAFLIKGGIACTPCARSHLCDSLNMEIYLKQEFFQYTGSFKERGARYALLMLTDEQKQKGVISASLGNHAQALSYHGWKLGIPVTVVMPLTAPLMKVQKCRSYKANVIVKGTDMGDAKRIAMEYGQENGLMYINGYDHPHIMAGQGTIGLEILEQVPNPDAVIIPVGGGGLIAGIATAVKALRPETRIIGVESERCPSFTKAMENGGPMHTPVLSTLADGLAVPTVGYNAYATAEPLIDKIVVVKEEYIALAILRLVEMEKCVVEGGGASPLAAILSGYLNDYQEKKIVLVLSGGNIDTTVLGRCLERGLATDGRLQKFLVQVSDRPGGVAELCKLLSNMGVSIKDIMHERAWMSDMFSVEVKVICETRDWDHTMELRKTLENCYKCVTFFDTPMAICRD